MSDLKSLFESVATTFKERITNPVLGSLLSASFVAFPDVYITLVFGEDKHKKVAELLGNHEPFHIAWRIVIMLSVTLFLIYLLPRLCRMIEKHMQQVTIDRLKLKKNANRYEEIENLNINLEKSRQERNEQEKELLEFKERCKQVDRLNKSIEELRS